MKKAIGIFFILILFFSFYFLWQKEKGLKIIAKDFQGKRTEIFCQGESCEDEINRAISLLSRGGEISLSKGIFLISASNFSDCSIKIPSNTSLLGKGEETVLKLKDGFNRDLKIICNLNQESGDEKITLKDFRIDGNSEKNQEGIQHGIFFKKTSDGKIENVKVKSMRKMGIFLSETKVSEISGSEISENGSAGLYFSFSSENKILKNKISKNDYGIILSFSSKNLISQNSIAENAGDGIYLESSSENEISQNKIEENGGAGPFDGIRLIENSNFNKISENEISNRGGNGFAINIISKDCQKNKILENKYSEGLKVQDLGKETVVE